VLHLNASTLHQPDRLPVTDDKLSSRWKLLHVSWYQLIRSLKVGIRSRDVTTNERTYQCRRLKTCKAWIPESSIEWVAEGDRQRPFCKPGMCPEKIERKNAAEELLALQLEIRRLRAKSKDAEAARERALARLEAVQEALTTALDIKDIFDQGSITPPEDPQIEEAVPILLLSDLHCGQIVKPSAVNDLNEFNPDIFDDRLDAVFRNALKVINGQRSTVTVREAVVWIGGDIIEGELHGDAVQNQTLTTTQQIVRAERALVRGLDYLLEHSDLERILVPTNVGNHGRNTKRQQSNATENSYEHLAYCSMRRHYRDEPRLEFFIADADCLYMDVYGHLLRFFHGDTVRYNGGAAGPMWNVDKHVKNLDQTISAAHTFHGHFHTLSFGSRATGNGSLPGCAPYGLQSGYRIERPQQGMRFLHSHKGFIGSFPVFTD